MSNLLQRVLTAIVLIPLVVGAILYLSWPWVGTLFAIALLAGAWEWTHLAGWSAPFVRIAYVAVLGAMLASAAMLPPQAVFWIIALAALWWGYALMRIVAVQRGASMSARSPLAWWLTGWILLIPPWLALVELHRGGGRGAALVLMIMVLVWTADIGAYFAGRAFGKRKLALRVSPGKSWEGAIGGLVLAVAAGWGYGAYALGDAWFAFVALCAVTVVLSVIGDLTESLFKRESKVKDSGGLLPGHGGVLDRIDSLTAAAPVFYLGTLAMGV